MSFNNIPVHICTSLFVWASLLRFNLFSSLRLSAKRNNIHSFINGWKNGNGRKLNKIKIKTAQEELLTGCLAAFQPCAGYYWLQAAEQWAPVWLWQHCMVRLNMWTDLLWEAGREEMTHLSASSHSYIMDQSFYRRLLFEITSRSFQLSFKLPLKKKKKNYSERIHPIQFEFVAGQVGSGLQAVAVHLIFGHEHGDGTALQVHFHKTFLWEKQQKGPVR